MSERKSIIDMMDFKRYKEVQKQKREEFNKAVEGNK